jgi:hypothetical protein
MTKTILQRHFEKTEVGAWLRLRSCGHFAELQASPILAPYLRREALEGAGSQEPNLMVWGAAADHVRSEAFGDSVYVALLDEPAPQQADASALVREVQACAGLPSVAKQIVVCQGEGLGLLATVAASRLALPNTTLVMVDFQRCGLELAQVALGFGASGLVGQLVSKRGLPIAEEEAKKIKGEGMVSKRELQRREIARVLRGARRAPQFLMPKNKRIEQRLETEDQPSTA